MVASQKKRTLWLEHLDADSASALGTGPYGFHNIPPAHEAEFPHGLPEHVNWFLVGGSCEVTVDGRRLDLSGGSALWIKPYVPFGIRVGDDGPMSLYRFRLLPLGDADDALEPVLMLRNAWDVRTAFDGLIGELVTNLPMREQRLRGLLLVLFTTLFRLADRHAITPPLDSTRRRMIESYVDEHITERPMTGELAAVVSMSASRFAERFRQTYGMPPRTWLVHRRVHHAAARLDTSADSITQVAVALGYPDVFLFSRQFKDVMGVSPRAYQMRGT
jgi:AraC-like DNA-binding protein